MQSIYFLDISSQNCLKAFANMPGSNSDSESETLTEGCLTGSNSPEGNRQVQSPPQSRSILEEERKTLKKLNLRLRAIFEEDPDSEICALKKQLEDVTKEKKAMELKVQAGNLARQDLQTQLIGKDCELKTQQHLQNMDIRVRQANFEAERDVLLDRIKQQDLLIKRISAENEIFRQQQQQVMSEKASLHHDLKEYEYMLKKKEDKA